MNTNALAMFSGESSPSVTTIGEESSNLQNTITDLFDVNLDQQSMKVLIQDFEESLATYSRNECMMENTVNIENYCHNQSIKQDIERLDPNSVYDDNMQQLAKRAQRGNDNLTVQPELQNASQRPQKRKSHRAVYSQTQLLALETAFTKNRFVSKVDRAELSKEIELTEIQIKTWFQNRRMKEKKKISKISNNFSANLSSMSTDSCSSGYSMSPTPPQAAGFHFNEHQHNQGNNGNYFLHPNYVYEQCKIDLSLYPQNQWNYASQYPPETSRFSYWQTPGNGLFQFDGVSYMQQLWNSQFHNNFLYSDQHAIKTEPEDDSAYQNTEEQSSNNLNYGCNYTLNSYMQNNVNQLGIYFAD